MAAAPDELRLTGDLAAQLDAWIEGAVARSGLSVRDVRRGVQSVSSVYVESRRAGQLGRRATESPARRAAFATYYAPLHFLATHQAVLAIGAERLGAQRILDLGCGTAACGVAMARAHADPPPVLGIDRSGWLLGEARHTFRAFGVPGRTRRATLPAGLPPLRAGDLAVAGYLLNELDDASRAGLLRELERGIERGARVLILEPLSGAVSPWWDATAEALAHRGVESAILKSTLERPAWIAKIDHAAGLDHREIGARVLFGPRANA
ncbi:MAG: class I SAM-dependent methyltransferase [Myxococcota bacterium]|nr:class I SAM-dependent methyltransferase [Myxococcota bacterium]